MWFTISTLLFSYAIAGESEKEILKPQESCPVMGGSINKDLFVDHEGKRVYFCCAMCKEPFLKEPAKYLTKMAESGEKPFTLPEKEDTK